jgi:hypothetical protein
MQTYQPGQCTIPEFVSLIQEYPQIEASQQLIPAGYFSLIDTNSNFPSTPDQFAIEISMNVSDVDILIAIHKLANDLYVSPPAKNSKVLAEYKVLDNASENKRILRLFYVDLIKSANRHLINSILSHLV